MKWRFWEAVIQWQRCPKSVREDVTGELEESAREIRDSDPNGSAARFEAADLLDYFADERVLGVNSTVVDDVKVLLAEVERLSRNVQAPSP